MENDTLTTTQAGSHKIVYLLGILLVIALLGAGWYLTQSRDYSYTFINGESVQNWDFQGAYTGNPELEAKARTEITKLEEMIGNEEDTETDYAIYVSLANQYHLLGDGAQEFAHLKKALAIESVTTGLAWHNLGYLLAQEGALRSARDAFVRAAKAQSQILQYHVAYLEFFTENFKEETGAIETGFGEAEAVFGDNSSLLEIKAHWLESIERYQDAIDAWEKVKVLSPGSAPVVDSEIARLKAQL